MVVYKQSDITVRSSVTDISSSMSMSSEHTMDSQEEFYILQYVEEH